MSLVRAHWAIAAGVLSTTFVALRILSAAWYDPVTAYGLLQNSGTANVLISAALALVGGAAPVVATTSFALLPYIKNDDRRIVRNVLGATAVMAAVVSFAATPIVEEFGMVLLVSATFWAVRIVQRLNRKLKRASELEESGELEEARRIREEVKGSVRRHTWMFGWVFGLGRLVYGSGRHEAMPLSLS